MKSSRICIYSEALSIRCREEKQMLDFCTKHVKKEQLTAIALRGSPIHHRVDAFYGHISVDMCQGEGIPSR